MAGWGVLTSRIDRRERALRAAWPGVVDHLRQAVRSGAGVGEAVWSLAEHVPAEIRPAFARYRQSLESGFSVSGALTQVKAEVANPVADRIIEALRMAHEVGGPELPRILADLQSSVRADWQVREDALAKQAWIRAASKLGVAAPWIVLVMISGRTETQTSYAAPAGIALLLVGAGVSAFAFKLMQKLGSLPPEKRWLA
jgi:tight adherence protein B